jgi:hypothetical protein
MDLRDALKVHLKPEEFCAPENTDFIEGQVVRGERFHQRPYVYLDFPKFFSRQAMFTYRAFFWWGWDFVFACLLAGSHLEFYKKNLIHHLDRISGKGYYLSIASTPWEWGRVCPTTVALTDQHPEKLESLLSEIPFLKIMYFVEMNDPVWSKGGLVEQGQRIFDDLRFVVAKKTQTD